MSVRDPRSSEALDRISIARQPIVNTERAVVAYELFNRTLGRGAHSQASDMALALHAVAESAAPFATSKHDVFIHSVHAGLEGPHWDFVNPSTTVIEVPPAPQHAQDFIAGLSPALQALRRRGFRLAFKHSVVAPVYKPWQALADFVKLDTARIDPAQRKPLVQAARSRTSARLIAEKIETAEQLESMAALGIPAFQGFWFSMPETIQSRVLTPGQAMALQLVARLQAQAPLDEIEVVLKKDAGLGVSLLRIINSAATGLQHKVTSLRQAVMLMGYARLTRWAAMLLTQTHDQANLQATAAVVRGRMMELLVQTAPGLGDAGAAFLVGLLSQIDQLLGQPMAELLNQLGLDDSVAEALQHGTGPYGALLALVVACESDDEAAFSAAFRQLPFSLRQINIAHMESLAWADSMEA